MDCIEAVRRALAVLALCSPGSLDAIESLVAVSRPDPSLAPATGSSQSYSQRTISDDGRWTAFTSSAADLAAGDTGGAEQVWIHDRVDDTSSLVSHAAGNPSAGATGGGAQAVAISGDGRYVLFHSSHTNLIAGASLAGNQVYLHDRLSATSVLVSHATSGTNVAANLGSSAAALSADGRWAVFSSDATDLVDGYSGSGTQLYLWDRDSGTVVLVTRSAASSTTGAVAPGHDPAVSVDGGRVAFWSGPSDLVAGGTGYEQTYLFEPATGTVSLVSHAAGTPSVESNSSSRSPSISDDGRWVAFVGYGMNLVDGFTSTGSAFAGYVYLWDRLTATTVVVSRAHSGATVGGDSTSGAPEISADGSWVAFESYASNLVAGYTGSNRQVYLWERASGAVTLASHAASSSTTGGNGESVPQSIAGDGSRLTFGGNATNLVAGQSGGGHQVFLFERGSGGVTLVSHAAGSPTVASQSLNSGVVGVLSGDGEWVAFSSPSPDLIADDHNDAFDVFLHEVASGDNALVSKRAPGAPSAGTGNRGSNHVALFPESASRGISDDGSHVAFESAATDLVAGYLPSFDGGSPNLQAFLFDRSSDQMTLVSHAVGAPLAAANGLSRWPVTSADGRWVAFRSTATNLVAGYSGSGEQLYLFDRDDGSVVLVTHTASGLTTGSNAPPDIDFALSADGRYVAFLSAATDLIAGYSGSGSQVWLWDREGGAIALASRTSASATAGGNGAALAPRLAADGSAVVFASAASDLVAGFSGPGGVNQVYAFDRAGGAVELLSTTSASASAGGNAASRLPHPSADGRWVAFQSAATDLVDGYVGDAEQIYLHDRQSGAITLVSDTATAGPTGGSAASQRPVVSADGAFVVFESRAVDLGATVSFHDMVWLWERASGAVTLVSHAVGNPGAGADGYCYAPRISADGRYVVFQGQASNLVSSFSGSPYGAVYRYDRLSGEVQLLSHRPGFPSANGDGPSSAAMISADGNSVVFPSAANDLVPVDVGWFDVFLWADLPDTSAPTAPTIDATDPATALWTSDTTIEIDWSGASDTGGSQLAGYSFLLDQQETTVPDLEIELAHAADPHSTGDTLAEGDGHWFHLRACDGAGNCSPAVHAGPFRIDTTPPGAPGTPESPSHAPDSPHVDPTIDVAWSAATDALSGVAGYAWTFTGADDWSCDGVADGDESALGATSTPLTDGSWWFHVCALDQAGNAGPVASAGPFVVDSTPPVVASFHTVGATPGGTLAENELVFVPVTQILIGFDEPMDSATFALEASWLLVGAGADGTIETATCGAVAPTDVQIAISTITTLGLEGAALAVGNGSSLVEGRYALLACDALTDLAGNALDGDLDTVAGGDARRRFALADTARLVNPNVESADGWAIEGTGVGAGTFAEDGDGAPVSGSFRINSGEGASGGATVRQCVAIEQRAVQVHGLHRLENSGLSSRLELVFSSGASCDAPIGSPRTLFTTGAATGGWVTFSASRIGPKSAGSVELRWIVEAHGGAQSSAGLDRIGLYVARFASGFETGSLVEEGWSAVGN